MAKVTFRRPVGKSKLQQSVELSGYVWNELFGMAEHRVVAMRLLNRALGEREHVHHCNRVKTDNAPYNLFVLTPAVHDFVHLAILLPAETRSWTSGRQLLFPETLSKFLKEEGIPHIWLEEVRLARLNDETTGEAGNADSGV